MKPTEFIVENSIIAQEADDMHRDHEVQMARSQLYSAAQAAIQIHRLLKDISEMEGLEGWVQSKITLASQYLESVRDHLKYEAVSQEPEMMPFAEDAANYALNKLVEEATPGSDAWLRQKTSASLTDSVDTDTAPTKEYSPGSDAWLRQQTGAPQPSITTPVEIPNTQNTVDVKPAPTRPAAGVNAAGQRAFQNYLNTQGSNLKLDGIVGPKTKAARDEYFTKLQASMPGSAISDPDYDKKWKDYQQKKDTYFDMQAIAAAHHVKPAPGKPYTWLDSPNYKEIFKKYNLDPATGLPAKPKMKEAAGMTGHGQFTSKDMGGGTKVSFNPTTGGKSVTDADGTTDYNVQGKAVQQTSPTVGGFNKTTNLQTGATSTQSQGGPMSVNASTSTGPAGKVTSVGGTVPAPGQPNKNISIQSTTGAMLGGAQGKGNQVTMVTNPQGVRTGVIGGDAGSEATAIKAMKETTHKKLKEMATGGASSAGGIATSTSGPANKKTSGVPKRVGNAYKPKKVQVGKGVY
jgi:hypothetical protein